MSVLKILIGWEFVVKHLTAVKHVSRIEKNYFEEAKTFELQKKYCGYNSYVAIITLFELTLLFITALISLFKTWMITDIHEIAPLLRNNDNKVIN